MVAAIDSGVSSGIPSTKEVSETMPTGEPTTVPHVPQKRSSGSRAAPQFGQARDREAPHFEQKLLPTLFSLPQFAQST